MNPQILPSVINPYNPLQGGYSMGTQMQPWPLHPSPVFSPMQPGGAYFMHHQLQTSHQIQRHPMSGEYPQILPFMEPTMGGIPRYPTGRRSDFRTSNHQTYARDQEYSTSSHHIPEKQMVMQTPQQKQAYWNKQQQSFRKIMPPSETIT